MFKRKEAKISRFDLLQHLHSYGLTLTTSDLADWLHCNTGFQYTIIHSDYIKGLQALAKQLNKFAKEVEQDQELFISRFIYQEQQQDKEQTERD